MAAQVLPTKRPERRRMQNDSFTDFYEVLQVSPNAEAETINRTYRLLALRYHPDNKETGDSDAFKLLIQAFAPGPPVEQRLARIAVAGQHQNGRVAPRCVNVITRRQVDR